MAFTTENGFMGSRYNSGLICVLDGIIVKWESILFLAYLRLIAFKAIFGQLVVEINRVAPVKTCFAKCIFRIGDTGGGQQTFDAQIVQRVQPQVLAQILDRHAGSDELSHR